MRPLHHKARPNSATGAPKQGRPILAEMSQDRIEECYDLFDAMLDVLPRKVKAALTVIILQFLHYEDERQKLAA